MPSSNESVSAILVDDGSFDDGLTPHDIYRHGWYQGDAYRKIPEEIIFFSSRYQSTTLIYTRLEAIVIIAKAIGQLTFF